jgi:hypothetical protein
LSASLLIVLTLAAETPTPPPPEALEVEGPAVVFVAPVGPVGDDLRQQMDRLKEALLKKKVKAVETTPTLIRLGEEDNSRKRMRQVDFRRTPKFVGTLLFTESYDPQIRQGVDTDEELMKRLEAYLGAAKKARAAQ